MTAIFVLLWPPVNNFEEARKYIMAKHLISTVIFNEIELLIREAREKLYVINPNLDIINKLEKAIIETAKNKVDVSIIFSIHNFNPANLGYLENLDNVQLFASKNLQDKCYLTETKMIITSNNISGAALQQDGAIGILFERTNREDKQAYDDTLKGIELILNNALHPNPGAQPISAIRKSFN